MFVSYTSLFTAIPIYVLDIGGQEWQIGIVIGSFGVVSLFVRPFVGRWINVFGPKYVTVFGLGLFAFAALLFIPAFNVWWLVPVRMLRGIGLSMTPVATSTIIANLSPPRRRAEGMAYIGASIGIGSLYAPVLGFWLSTQYGFEAAFVFSSAAAFLGMLFALRLSSSRISLAPSETSTEKVPLISRAAIFPTLVFISYTATTAPVTTFLPLIAEENGLGNPGLYFTVNSLTMMITLLGAGVIADRLGRPAVIIPGLLAAAAAMFLLMAASNQAMLLMSAFLAGGGFGLLQPGIQSLTVDRVTARERGSAMATLQSAWDIGSSGASFAIGPIAGAFSVAATFGVVGVGALMGTVAFVFGNARSPSSLPGSQQETPPPSDD